VETHAVLLLAEEILEPEPARGRATSYLTDMQMMPMFGRARARTDVEFRNLLDFSFSLRRVIPTSSAVCIIDAVRMHAGAKPQDAVQISPLRDC